MLGNKRSRLSKFCTTLLLNVKFEVLSLTRVGVIICFCFSKRKEGKLECKVLGGEAGTFQVVWNYIFDLGTDLVTCKS